MVDSSDELSSKLDYAALAWIAPELYTPPIRPSTASDIWALGCLIYFLFTWGKHPFDSPEGRSIADRVTNITNKKVNFSALKKQNIESLLNARLETLIRSMIDNNPSLRPRIHRIIHRLKYLKIELFNSTQIQPITDSSKNIVLSMIDGVFDYLRMTKVSTAINSLFSSGSNLAGPSSSSKSKATPSETFMKKVVRAQGNLTGKLGQSGNESSVKTKSRGKTYSNSSQRKRNN